MCRQLLEMGGGVDDLHCFASVHHLIRGHQDEQLDSR